MARSCRLRDETIGFDVVLLLLDNAAGLDDGDEVEVVLVVVDTAAGLFDDVLSIEYIGDCDFALVGSDGLETIKTNLISLLSMPGSHVYVSFAPLSFRH